MHDGLSWAPRQQVFVRRSLITGAVTFVVFTVLALLATIYVPQYLMVSAVMPFVLTLILFMDDFMRWRQLRGERWEISDGHLIHDGQDGRAAIPLAEIRSVKRRIGNSVVIRLRSGQRIVMRYLPYPAQTAEQIDTARPPETS